MININCDGYSIDVPTLEDAFLHVLASYEHAVFYDASGWEVVVPDEDDTRHLTHGERILAWRTEAESVNDDGAKAIAAITWKD